MSRSIPIALKDDLAAELVTPVKLVRIGPFRDGSYCGFTEIDQTVEYDDATGVGPIAYNAPTGAELSAQVATSDLGVDNAEMRTLPPQASHPETGLTLDDIRRGEIDDVPFVVYVADFENLSPGRHFILGGGTVGEIRQQGSLMLVLEQRSLSSKLKQTVGFIDTVTCPKRFGSQHYGTGGGVIEELHPCTYDISTEWVAFTVTDVDAADPDLLFETGLTEADDYFAPGMIEVLTGANIGIEIEVMAYAAGVVRLAHAAPEAFAAGDTGRIRRRCTKRWSGHNSCFTFHAAARVSKFGGLPHMQSGEAVNNAVPGAGIGGGGAGGTGEIGDTEIA